MPTSTNAQDFLKPGEKGAGVDIKDARYVVSNCRHAGLPAAAGNYSRHRIGPRRRPRMLMLRLRDPRTTRRLNETTTVPPRYRDMIH